MMISDKIFHCLAVVAACSLLLAAGCASADKETVETRPGPEEQLPAVRLALEFTPQDSTTYRVITERERSVELEGALSDDAILEGGHTGSRVEITFTQQIQSVDDEGNAVAKITIKEVKYSAKVKDETKVAFDSSRKEDQRNPLAKLIGQSYTIKISPAGKVVGEPDVRKAQAAIRGRSPAGKTALELLKRDAVKGRHTIPALPLADKNQVRPGDSWNRVKKFSYDLMGAESYERIYTLKEIKGADGRRIAIVEMNAIPSSEMAEQLYKEQATSAFSKMFDSTKTYTGQLKLDLTAGKVEKYFEKLQIEWVVVDLSIKQGDDKGPAALKMGVLRLYSLEKID